MDLLPQKSVPNLFPLPLLEYLEAVVDFGKRTIDLKKLGLKDLPLY